MIYFGDFSGELFDAYTKAAWNQSINDRYRFYQITDASCAEQFGHNAGNSSGKISLTRLFDEEKLAYTGEASEASIVSFAKKGAVPQLINFSDEYIEPVFAEGNPALILMTEQKDKPYQEAFALAAKEMQGEIYFITSALKRGAQSRLGDYLNFK